MYSHESGDERVGGIGSDRLSRRVALRSAAGGGFVALAAGASPLVSAQATPTAIPPIVEKWVAAWNAHSPEQMAALYTDDGVHEDLAFGIVSRGQEEVAGFIAATLAAAPDTRAELDYAFQDGDRAAALWTWSGTYTGAFAPTLPATGQPFAVPIASLFELEGELIRRVGDYYNLGTWMTQVGLAAGPGGPAEASPAATPPA